MGDPWLQNNGSQPWLHIWGALKKKKLCPGRSKTIKSKSLGVGRPGNSAFLTPRLFQPETEVVSCGSSLRAFQSTFTCIFSWAKIGANQPAGGGLMSGNWKASQSGEMGRESVDTRYKLPSLFGGALLTSSQGTLSQIEGRQSSASGTLTLVTATSMANSSLLYSLPYLTRCPLPPPLTPDLGTQTLPPLSTECVRKLLSSHKQSYEATNTGPSSEVPPLLPSTFPFFLRDPVH